VGGDGAGALSAPGPSRALVELTIFLALEQSYLWLWSGVIPRGIYVVSAAVLGLAIASILVRRETAREIGLRLDNLGRALAAATVVTIPAAAGLLAAGARRGAMRPGGPVAVEPRG